MSNIDEKIKNVTGKLNERTSRIIKQLCTDDEWSSKVMGCSVETFNDEIMSVLEEFKKLSDSDKNDYIGGVLDSMPKHLHILESRKSTSAIVRATNFINAIGRDNIDKDEKVDDEVRFSVICIIRLVENDIVPDAPKGDRRKNFEAKGDTSDDKKTSSDKSSDKDDSKDVTVLRSWIKKALVNIDKEGKQIDSSLVDKCAKSVCKYIVDHMDKLDGTFGDMGVRELRNFSNDVAKNLFDMNPIVHNIGMDNTGSDAQMVLLAKAWKNNFKASIPKNEPTMLDKWVDTIKTKFFEMSDSDKNDMGSKFVNQILHCIIDSYGDAGVADAFVMDTMPEIESMVSWMYTQLCSGNKAVVDAIINNVSLPDQLIMLHSLYEDHLYDGCSCAKAFHETAKEGAILLRDALKDDGSDDCSTGVLATA